MAAEPKGTAPWVTCPLCLGQGCAPCVWMGQVLAKPPRIQVTDHAGGPDVDPR